MKKYNKLVRDNILELIKKSGGEHTSHIARDSEYGEKLNEKLLEEVKEYSESESEEELADILEVIDAIIKNKNFELSSIKKLQEEKREERGAFEKRIILDESK